jgi:hypothetical protein
MPLIRAEQVQDLTLKDLQVANDAAIKQHKIEHWDANVEWQDASDWISKGIIKPVTTANLPAWDGSQAGEFYYDVNTNELFIGISTPPYYQLIAGAGLGDGGTDRIIVVKMSYEAEDWTGVSDTDIAGTGTKFSLDTDKVNGDGANLMVYLNGVLQERGSGNDYILFEEGGVDKIQFNYNVETHEQKLTAIVNVDTSLVNYATKAYVDGMFVEEIGNHYHRGNDSPQLDFNEAITALSLGNIIHSILPADGSTVNLGSTTRKFNEIHADEVFVGASSLYVNGKKVLESVAETMTFETDTDEAILIKTDATTAGTGNSNITLQSGNEINATAAGGFEWTVGATAPSKHINFSNMSTNGNITLNASGAGSAVQLDAVSQIALTAAQTDIVGDLNITGNLYISGTTTTVETTTLSVGDNIVLLNGDTVGTPTENAGIEIERGDSTNYRFIFDEVDDNFKVGEVGALQPVATRQDAPEATGIAYWDAATNRFVTSASLTFNGTKINGTITSADQADNATTFDGNTPADFAAATHSHTIADLPDLSAGATSQGFIRYNGQTAVDGMMYGGATDPTGTARLNYDGYFYATRVYNAVYNDLAEFMPGFGEAGQVLVQTEDGLKPSTKRGDGAVVGVYSDSYGYALGGDEDSEGKVPVGLSGRVWVWIEEPCDFGDLLITGDKEGFAAVKRASEDGLGKVFAKVMQKKADSKPERIEVLILMA